MQWLIIAQDGTDQDAPRRRLDARPVPLELAQFATRKGLGAGREIEVHPYRVAPHYDVPSYPQPAADNQPAAKDIS